MPHYNPEQLKRVIWQTCFSVGDTVQYASGQRGNNKLDIERCKKIAYIRTDIAERLGKIATLYNPKFVTAVPNGANWIGRDVARLLQVPFVEMHKYDDGTVDIHCQRSTVSAYQLDSCVLVEDVFNQFTNTRKTLAVPPIGDKALAVIAVWDRGDSVTREALPLPAHSIIREHIPAMYGQTEQAI